VDRLPSDLPHHFREALDWEGNGKSDFVIKRLEISDHTRPLALWNALHGDGIRYENIYAVYNPLLVDSFILTWQKIIKRATTDADIFINKRWKNIKESSEDTAQREWVLQTLQERLGDFSWNNNISVCHLRIFTNVFKISHNT